MIWTFNGDNHRLNVNNNVVTTGPENIYSGLPTGSYSYSIREEGGVNVLYVDGAKQGDMANTSDNLVINSETDDTGELKKVFRR